MTAAVQIPEAICHLRPVSIVDEAFLLELYAQTRTEELAQSGLDVLQREVFVQMQFRARQISYQTVYPLATDEIICTSVGVPVGRVLVDRKQDGMRLIDIEIMTEWRRQGFGTQVIRELQHECAARDGEMGLQVLKGSPAERLYRRLGFKVAGEDPLRRQMVWDRTRVRKAHGMVCGLRERLCRR